MDSNVLEAVNQEKFRRKMLISSRVIAIFLVFGLIYWGYTYQQYGIMVTKSPCYACGLYAGKKCDVVYYTPQEIQTAGRENLLKSLAEYNSNTNVTQEIERMNARNNSFSLLNYTNFTIINYN